jgi:adenosine kinase
MIVTTGSLAYDIIMDFNGKFAEHIDPSKIHILNISFLVDSFKKERGGNSANIAYTLALLGMKTSILSNAGEDFSPYKKFLNSAGVLTDDVNIVKGESTATAIIMTDKSDNQISAFYPGAMKQNTKLSLKKAKNKPVFAVITPDVPEAMHKLALECKALKIPYLFDPGMQLPRLTNKQLLEGIENADVLAANDYEMGIIEKRLKLTGKQLLKKVKVLITTLGEKGSVIESETGMSEIRPAPVKSVVDPTGAGDAYRAGFLAGFLRGFDLLTCGQMGSVASCYAIEKYGTTNHKFSVAEFKKRYTQNYGKLNGKI